MWKLGVEQGVECASKTRMGGKKKWDFKGKKILCLWGGLDLLFRVPCDASPEPRLFKSLI